MENNIDYKKILNSLVSMDNFENPNLEFKSKLEETSNSVTIEISSCNLIVKGYCHTQKIDTLYKRVFNNLFIILIEKQKKR